MSLSLMHVPEGSAGIPLIQGLLHLPSAPLCEYLMEGKSLPLIPCISVDMGDKTQYTLHYPAFYDCTMLALS